MASEQDDNVLPDEDLDDDNSSSQEYDDLENDDVIGEEEEEEEDVDDLNSPSTSSLADPSTTVTVAVAGISAADPPPTTAAIVADLKRQGADGVSAVQEERKPLDDSRRLFQRLWTDEDEIELLQGFLDYTAQRGGSSHHHHHHHHNDTALFYDQIKSKLQLDFNKNQLVEKLRRLKKKYRNVLGKISSGKDFSFKSSHDQSTFEISRKIWSNEGRIDNALDDDDSNPNPNPNPNFNLNLIVNEVKVEEIVGNSSEKKATPRPRKRKRVSNDTASVPNSMQPNLNNNDSNNANNNAISGGNLSGVVEESVRSCLSPLFKELLSNAMGGPCTAGARGFRGLSLNPVPLSFGGGGGVMNFGSGEMVDDKWRKQHILELEVYSKRLELVQDQIKVALEELRSISSLSIEAGS